MAHPPHCLAAFLALLAMAVLWDLQYRRVPNPLVVALAGSGLLCQLFVHGWRDVGTALAAALLVGALLYVPWTRNRIGGGDLKLASAAAIWLGWGALPVFLLSGALAGGALAGAVYFALDRRDRIQARANLLALGIDGRLSPARLTPVRTTVPYACAIAAGAVVALGWGG